MRTARLFLLYFIAFFGLLPFTSCDKNDDPVQGPLPTGPDLIFYALRGGTALLKINAMAPQTVISNASISGLQPGEMILGMDFRPATGQLYGVGSTNRLYVIELDGRARAIGAAPFAPGLSGIAIGFDFNPTVDRIRIVTSTGQNLRLNPETGTVAASDGAINGASTPYIIGSAYTNNTAGASSTTLFNIDIFNDKLYKQDPPNNGTLIEVGAFGTEVSSDGGFDIAPDGVNALAAMTFNGKSNLFTIDLTTGKVNRLGLLGPDYITGIAIPTNPVAYAVDNTNNLLTFNLNAPGTPVSKAITGLQAGETILGLDLRPVNGQLYGLGSTSRLYTINMSNGAAAAVGPVFATPLSGTSFGFDFNPTVDRIRVISNTGQNLRLNPNDGSIAATDAVLNPATTGATAAAYVNNFAGAVTTTLFDIDVNTDKLYIQNPPNNGTLVEVGALGIDVDMSNGFDIGGTSGKAYALLTVGSATKIYSINLTTGAASAVGDLPVAGRALAVGLGF